VAVVGIDLLQVAANAVASRVRVLWSGQVACSITSARWEIAFHEFGPVADTKIDPWRPVVIARSLDQIAHAIERISDIAREINLRASGR
jgi:hypothetical protein